MADDPNNMPDPAEDENLPEEPQDAGAEAPADETPSADEVVATPAGDDSGAESEAAEPIASASGAGADDSDPEPAEPAAADEADTVSQDTGGGSNTFSQDELDALAAELAAASGGGGSEPTASKAGNTINQSELDALNEQLAATGQPAMSGDEGSDPSATEAAEQVDALAEEMAAAIAQEAAAASGGGAVSSGDPSVVGAARVKADPKTAEEYAAPELDQAADAGAAEINMLDDVNLEVKIELGRTGMYIEDVLQLAEGSVVQLDKLAGDPVDIYVNDKLIAHGEVLVLNENFCVRINDIDSPIPELD